VDSFDGSFIRSYTNVINLAPPPRRKEAAAQREGLT